VPGLFRSSDSTRTWTRLDDERHQYGTIHQVAGDPRVAGRVFLATEGRGVIYGDDKAMSVGIGARTSPAAASLRRIGSTLVSKNAIELLDLRGRVVRRSTPTADGFQLSLGSLSGGLYYAKAGHELLPIVHSRR
jgi:hypothetical protein